MICKNSIKECDGCMRCYEEIEYYEDDTRIYCADCSKELEVDDENIYKYYIEYFCEDCAQTYFKEDLEKKELIIKKVFTEPKMYDIVLI